MEKILRPFASADRTQPSQVANQTRHPHSESQSDPPMGLWGSGLGGEVIYGSRGGANLNEFGRDPTEFGQLIYDTPPEYPLSARTPPSVFAWERKWGRCIHMHVATRECMVAWDVACITSVAGRGQSPGEMPPVPSHKHPLLKCTLEMPILMRCGITSQKR